MKRLLTTLTGCWLALTGLTAQEQRAEVLMLTNEGAVRIELYNETTQHRDNFLKLCDVHVYDSLLFHRVIKDFMVQGGNPATRQGSTQPSLSATDLDYTVEAEIRYPQLFHKRGVLAAAREGDDANPERRSSATQFYFVWGRKYSERAMEFMESRLPEPLPPAVREAYMTVGGSPHLDGGYTVFGEITEGLDVVERIQHAATDEADRPLQPVMIISTTVTRRPQ